MEDWECVFNLELGHHCFDGLAAQVSNFPPQTGKQEQMLDTKFTSRLQAWLPLECGIHLDCVLVGEVDKMHQKPHLCQGISDLRSLGVALAVKISPERLAFVAEKLDEMIQHFAIEMEPRDSPEKKTRILTKVRVIRLSKLQLTFHEQ